MSILSEPEAQAYLASIDGVDRFAASKLREIDDVARAVTFVANLHAGVDRVVAGAAARGAAFDCKPGCAHCCRARVEVTEPEVFLMVRWVRNQPDRYVTGLVERLRQRAQADTAARAAGPACAFLVDERCSAYAVRPATCRAAHSLSVAACATLAPAIPQDLALVAEAEALMIGTARAYRSVRLAASPRELNEAVLTVLDDAQCESRWHDGRRDRSIERDPVR